MLIFVTVHFVAQVFYCKYEKKRNWDTFTHLDKRFISLLAI